MPRGEGSFVGDLNEQVVVRAGEITAVTFTVPDPTRPRNIRLAAPEPEDTASWRVRSDDGDTVVIEANGTVPIDLRSAGWYFHVEATDGRRWSIEVPRAAQHGEVVPLTRGGASLRGEVRDREGAPLVGIGVRARLHGTRENPVKRRVDVVAITDEDGRFELTGLAAGTQTISLRSDPNATWSNDAHVVDGTHAEVQVVDGEDHWVTLRIPSDRETIRIEGRSAQPTVHRT